MFAMQSFVTLLLILTFSGGVIARVMELTGFSQYLCNFVLGVIITVYAMENFILLGDLTNQGKNLDSKHTNEIKNAKHMSDIAVKNDRLANDNSKLKEELRRIKQKVNQETTTTLTWRDGWPISKYTIPLDSLEVINSPITQNHE